LIRGHVDALGLGGQTKLLRRDATDLGRLEKMKPFDLVFLDPPYAQGLAEHALRSAMEGGWLAPDALIVLEERRDVDPGVPQGFVPEDRRDYGDTSVHFLVAQASGPRGSTSSP
jgi:16S rRNA (guanine966-N2)-methyltransferase